MPKASPIILSFSSGELSKLFDGRVDLEEYASGCRQLENMIPLIQGPATRRGGTRYVREVKDSSDRTGSLRFEFNTEQAYFLEIGDQYMRFYTDHGIVMNGTNPLELATPWTAADLFDAAGNFLLRSTQSGDVMYITHVNEDYPPQKLVRTGALSWAISEFEPDGGPFKDIDPDATITVYASSTTGSVTLVASSAIFTASYIGALFLMEAKNTDDTKAWEAAKSITSGNIRRVENRYYSAVNTATTGAITPSHTRGAIYDGDAGVQWTFLHPGYGWGKITAVGSSGTTATMTVQSRLPAACVGSGNPTTRWAFGAWNDVDGWPTHVTFFRERLTFLRASDFSGWCGVAGDFENFASRDDGGEIVADAALRFQCASDKVNKIEWVVPGDFCLIGTAGEEFVLGEITTTEPFGPGNAKCVPNTAYGSKPVPPVLAGDSLLFVQRSGRKLRDLRFSIEKGASGGLVSSNLSVLASHLLPRGTSVIGLAYQQEPYSVIWAVRSDGLLLATTLNANQKRFGWHRHPLGGDGIVESIQVIPNEDGGADEIWMIVKRTIDGTTARYVEYMEQDWDGEGGEDIIEAFYVDSGLTYDGAVAATLTPGTGANVVDSVNVPFTAGSSVFSSGDVGKEIWYRYYDATDEEFHTARAEITQRNSGTIVEATILSPWPSLTAIASGGWRKSVTTISGLDHLEGETVDVLVDGSTHPQVTVSSGSITLDAPATYVHVGLPCPCKLQPMRPEAGSADGTAQGKTKRINTMVFRFLYTVGGSVGPDEASLDDLQFRSADDEMDEALPPFTGDIEVPWPDGYSTEGNILYVNDQPLPATLACLMPQITTSDR